MTNAILNWLWNIGSRDLCALIGIAFIAASGIAWIINIPSQFSNSLDNIANAIRKRDYEQDT